MPCIVLPNNDWRPRPYQRRLWDFFERGGKRAAAVWHRRSGKDDVALHWAAVDSMQRIGVRWHMLPEAAQARKAVWDAVNPHSGKRRIDEAFPIELRDVTRDNEMFIRFKNGSTWQVVGSDNYNSLVGSPPVGIVFSEWALADPASWAYLRPILRENGGWALFIYTPRGRNHGATTYEAAKDDPEWFAEKLTAEDTGVFGKDDLERELREYKREFGVDDGESRFRQEYMCDFSVAVIGAYYGRLMTAAEDEDRITAVAHDKALKVDTWWDLGHADATAIWFVQHVFNAIHVIDYYEVNGASLDSLAAVLQRKREEHGYIYGEHIWPHDGGHKTLASKGRPLSAMMADLGFTVGVQPRHDLEVGITRVRQILSRCWFDRKNCALGLEALRNYHKEWDDQRRAFNPKPYHDWSSHGADAFRTGAMSHHDHTTAMVARRKRYEAEKLGGGSSWAA